MQLQRPRRWCDGDGDGEEGPTTAGGGGGGGVGCRCRSCAAVMLADCIALGCCPCAVVSMLSLALVKAPLAVGRRCVGRLRSRRRTLLHNKRVRDVAATSTAAAGEKKAIAKPEEELEAAADILANDDDTASAAAAAAAGGAVVDEDLAWLEEMYQMGHWGFGRVSISGKTP
uniref:Uncharacterized protein n=1 Tax=Oryza meridionalis TaxID=40149 RepID=A0A0E0D6G3_9ORYZ